MNQTQQQNSITTPIIEIIDDDESSCMILKNLLSKEGYRTITAHNGLQGRQLAQIHKPDLVILDIHMPIEDGLTTCTLLKSNPSTHAIPVIFITSQDDIEMKVRSFSIGAVDYITKPFQPLEVLARVKVHIRLAHSLSSVIEAQIAKITRLAEAQTMILPKIDQMPEAQCAVFYRQLARAGGDFYDIIQVSEQVFDYISADVSGHDLSIALVTSALKTLFKQNCTPFFTPSEVILLINKILKSVLQEHQYITLSWIRVNRQSKKAYVINAGNPPLIMIPRHAPLKQIESKSDIIGIFEHILVEQTEVPITTGDRFFLYSDGVIESDKASQLTSEQKLLEIIQICDTYRSSSISETVKAIETYCSVQFIPRDDITILGIEI